MTPSVLPVAPFLGALVIASLQLHPLYQLLGGRMRCPANNAAHAGGLLAHQNSRPPWMWGAVIAWTGDTVRQGDRPPRRGDASVNSSTGFVAAEGLRVEEDVKA